MQQTTLSTALLLLRLLCCCFRFAAKHEDASIEYQEAETQAPTKHTPRQRKRMRHSATPPSGPLNSGTSSGNPLETDYDADSESEDGYLVVKRKSDRESDTESYRDS